MHKALKTKNKKIANRAPQPHSYVVAGRNVGKSVFLSPGVYYDNRWEIIPTETIVINSRDLEKYPAMKEAYEHFRMIEKMCIGGKRIE